MAKKMRVKLEEILATFSSHVSKNYPSPEDFQERLRLLLDNKKEGKGSDVYARSLETNVVFLHDLVTGGRALLDLLLSPDKEPKGSLDVILEEMEGKIRSQTRKRHTEIFERDGDEEFRELAGMRRGKSDEYIERLEFNYLYLMTFRMLLFEFMSVLQSIRAEYQLADMKPGAVKEITDSLALTAHFYLGNVKVGGESGEGTGGEARH